MTETATAKTTAAPPHSCFRCLAPLGQRLTAMHLLESPLLDDPGVTFGGGYGGSLVAPKHPRYDAAEGRVYVNAAQYFEGIAPEVWAFQVGGYQPCEKWLKDRRGRVLSADDVRHYCRTAAALRETIRIQGELDDVTMWRRCPRTGRRQSAEAGAAEAARWQPWLHLDARTAVLSTLDKAHLSVVVGASICTEAA